MAMCGPFGGSTCLEAVLGAAGALGFKPFFVAEAREHSVQDPGDPACARLYAVCTHRAATMQALLYLRGSDKLWLCWLLLLLLTA